MTALVEARGLWREYGSNIVLENINVRVNAGEFITIVGASGCGKTTFLNMLLGVDTPTRGELLLDGRPIPGEPGPDRGIVFQKYSVFPNLSVLETDLPTTLYRLRLCNGTEVYIFEDALQNITGTYLSFKKSKL